MPQGAVRIYDPDDLTDAERDMARTLLDAPAAVFDETVRRYVRRADDKLRHVLYSSDVAQETLATLGRLHAEAVQALDDHPPQGRLRQPLQAHVNLIATMRRELRPYVNLAVAAAADQGTRRRAEQLLGRARYAELRQIIRDLDGGMDGGEALAAYQARAGRRQ
jgi:hypothetical protein